MVADTAGPLGLALQGLSDLDRAAVKADVEDSLSRFAADRGYEIPGSRCVRRQAEHPTSIDGGAMRRTGLMALGLAVVLLFGAEAASAFIAANTIDERATYEKHGRLLRVSGPIACTRGERVAIRVAVRQPATAARARNRWKGRCTGEVQHWQVRARARRGTRFENGRGRVCAVAKTRSGTRVTDRRRWCERVSVLRPDGGRSRKTVAEDVCFTVNNIGDPIPSTVRGTLFRSRKKPRSGSTALLLQHGAVSERSAWSGGAPVIEGTHDMARALATKGYAVFAIDRLGYGESPYERPSGIRLAAGPGRLHRDDPPDGHPDPRRLLYRLRRQAGGTRRRPCRLVWLQLGGRDHHGLRHSLSGHRRDHPDVLVEPAAVVGGLPGARRRPGAAARRGRGLRRVLPRRRRRLLRVLRDVPFLPPGAKARLLRQVCGPDYYAETAFPTPSGEGALPALQATTTATIGNVGPTPVLLVFSDRDAFFPGPDHHGTDPDS